MKLYELTATYRAIEKALDDDPENRLMLTAFDAVQDALEEKAVNMVKFMRNIEATAEAIKNEEARMASRRKAMEAQVEQLYNYLLNNMVACDIKKIESPWFKISLVAGRDSVVIDDLKKIPKEYLIEKDPAPDKKKILDDLNQGVVIEGVSTTKKPYLTIK